MRNEILDQEELQETIDSLQWSIEDTLTNLDDDVMRQKCRNSSIELMQKLHSHRRASKN